MVGCSRVGLLTLGLIHRATASFVAAICRAGLLIVRMVGGIVAARAFDRFLKVLGLWKLLA